MTTPINPTNIAVLIDAENISHNQANTALKIANEQGNSLIRRAYANWSKAGVANWQDALRDNAIVPVQQFEHIAGKNASDMVLAVDAMELVLAKGINQLILISSDSDFTPLVLKVREYGVSVIGIGAMNASKALVSACNQFFYLSAQPSENKTEPKKAEPKVKTPPPTLPTITRTSPVVQLQKGQKDPNKDKKLVALVKKTFDEKAKDGLLNQSCLGTAFAENGIAVSQYGFEKLGELVGALVDFDIYKDSAKTTSYIVRRESVAVVKPYDDSVLLDSDLVIEKTSDSAKAIDTALTNAIASAIAVLDSGNGWVGIELLADELLATHSLAASQYGYDTIEALLKNLPTFEVKKVAGELFVSDTRFNETAVLPTPAEVKQSQNDTPQQQPSTKAVQAQKQNKEWQKLHDNTTLMTVLDAIMIAGANETGWVLASTIGAKLKQAGITPKALGYKNATLLMQKIGDYELKTSNDVNYFKDFEFAKKRKAYLATLAEQTAQNEPDNHNAPNGNDTKQDEPFVLTAVPAETQAEPKAKQAKSPTEPAPTDKPPFIEPMTLNLDFGDDWQQDAPSDSKGDDEHTNANQSDGTGETSDDEESFGLADLLAVVNAGIDTHKNADGFAKVGDIGKYVRAEIGVGASAFGYADFGKLLAELPRYEVVRVGRAVLVAHTDE